MPPTTKPYWEYAVQSLRRVLADEPTPEATLARSQERVLRYREHLEQAALRSKYRSGSFHGPDPAMPVEGGTVAPRYRVLVLAPDGGIAESRTLAARDDDEALSLASAIVDGHAVDLWDGLRFMEHFEPGQDRSGDDRAFDGPGSTPAGPHAR